MATINIRVDDSVKTDAQEVLDAIGLSMSSAISIYLKQIALHKAIPFRLAVDAPFEPTENLKGILAEVRGDISTDRNLTPPMSGEETLAYLKSLRT